RYNPHMSRWIEKPRRPVAPELILSRYQDCCAHSDRTLDGLVYVYYVNEDDHGRAPISSGCAAGNHVWKLGLNHQERVVDAHRYMNWGAIRARSPHLLNRSERRCAEAHLGFRALANQHGKYGLHTFWDRFDCCHCVLSRITPFQPTNV